MLEFAYFSVKCIVAIAAMKYVSETIQCFVIGSKKEQSLFWKLIEKRLSKD